MYRHVQLMIELMDKGAVTFDYGNNIRARAQEYEQAAGKTITIVLLKPVVVLIFQVLYQHTSALCSAKEKVRSDGRH